MAVILPHTAAIGSDSAAAAASILAALALAWIVSRLLAATERRLAERKGLLALDPAGKTRLRLVRRLAFAGIIGVGVLVALLQFDSFDRLAGAVLASSAVVGAIAGLAARESLANVIAGVTLALTQPIRVGDLVEVGDARGLVDDLTLTFTWLRLPDGRRVALPNELLMTQAVRNDSLIDNAVVPSASVWIAGDADEQAALAALRTIDGVREACIEEVTPAGVRLRVARDAGPAGARAATEQELRELGLAALRRAGVARPSAG